MLKKTCVTGGLVIAAAAGTLLTGSGASAEPMGGFGGGCFSSCAGGLNWSGHRNVTRNRLRIRIRNRNNNVAVARNVQRERQDQRQFERQRARRQGGDP